MRFTMKRIFSPPLLSAFPVEKRYHFKRQKKKRISTIWKAFMETTTHKTSSSVIVKLLIYSALFIASVICIILNYTRLASLISSTFSFVGGINEVLVEQERRGKNTGRNLFWNEPEKTHRVFFVVTVVVAVISLLIALGAAFKSPQGDEQHLSDVDTLSIPVETVEPTEPIEILRVKEIKIYYNNLEETEFTIHMGEPPVHLRAVAYPEELSNSAQFVWQCSDNEHMLISVSSDTKYCDCTILYPCDERISLSASCDGVIRTIYIRLCD